MQELTLWQGVVYYLIRLVMFGAVAAIGIAAGIKFRKSKNKKEEQQQQSE